MEIMRSRKRRDALKIINDTSTIVMWLGLLFLVSAVTSLIFSEDIWPFYILYGALISGSAFIINKLTKNENETFMRHGIITAAVAWIVVAIVCGLPFYGLLGMNPLDSVYESMSALTTTGMSLIQYPENVYKSLLFFRTLEAWIGGIGITTVALYGLLSSKSASSLILGEGHEKVRPNIVNTLKEIVGIYSLWTLLGIIALIALGLTVFDSTNYVMNAISTTGNSIYSESLAHYQITNPENFWFINAVLAVMMLVGAIGFVVHYRFFKNFDFNAYLEDYETGSMIAILLAGILIMGAFLYIKGNPGDIGIFAFEAIDGMTCGGFQMHPNVFQGVSDFILATLTFLALVGGSQGSAAGGLKVDRVVILLKATYWKIREHLSPKGTVITKRVGNEIIDNNKISEVALFSLMYIITIVIVSMFLVAYGHSAMDSLFTVTMVQANAGMSPINPWLLETPVKAVLILVMWLGRLEFWPVLALFAYLLKK